MFKRFLVKVALLLLAVMFFNIAQNYTERQTLGKLAHYYVEQGPDELGAANLVTAVVVTYRGLDTLGEVTVLFISAAGVGLLLRRRKQQHEDAETETEAAKVAASELVQTAAQLLTPMIFLLGVYIFLNGHLTPGGGFQGGAVIASGTLLLFLALPHKRLNHTVVGLLESLSGFSYVVVGMLGVVLAGGFLDNRIIELGRFGTLLSAGAIPLIYIFVGLKVGTELSAVLERFKDK